jgi:serine phosphatase RsbU (regulator of sigma subunit)
MTMSPRTPTAAPATAAAVIEPWSARSSVPGEQLDVVRRLHALSRISGQLPSLRRETELFAAVVDSLHVYFECARHVRVFVADPEHNNHSQGYARERGRGLEPIECAGIDALPAEQRDLFMAPKLIPADGTASRGAIISAPLLEGTALLGLLTVEAETDALDFTPSDLDTLAGVAAQVSMAIQHLRSSGRVCEQRQLERDLKVAQRIQRSFLPTLPAAIGKFRLATVYRPAFQVGGDFYDVVDAAPGQVIAMIGDVSGKGVSGALMMSRVSQEMRRLACQIADPHLVMEQLNDALGQQICDDTFVTAACARFDSTQRTLTVANAGHVVPLVRRPSGEVISFGDPSGPPVAMLPKQTYVDETMQLEPGDIVLFMTDGVLDALHSQDDPLGISTLRDLVSRMPPDIEDINRRIVAAVDARSSGARADDITLLSIEVLP